MANVKESDLNGIYLIEGEGVEVWNIKNTKHLKKFWKYLQKKKIMPGDIIPKRIFKKYFERSE